jgi:hypothetical protein
MERNGGSKIDVLTSVLLSGAETWKVEKKANKSLRKILKIHWPDKISSIELWNKTKQEPVETTAKRRKWH